MATASSIDTFAGDFERVRRGLAGPGLAWLDALREGAMESLASAGLPTVRNEDWKYTNIAPALRDHLEPVLADDPQAGDDAVRALLARATAAEGAEHLLVFVDGHWRASLSRVGAARGLAAGSLRARLAASPASLEPVLGRFLPASAHGFTALGTAFLDDGAVIEIADGAAIESPVHVVHVSTRRAAPFVTHPRGVVVAGAGSSAVVVEHFVGEEGARALTNAGLEVVVRRDASLGHVRVQDEAASAWHVARVQVEQEAGSRFTSHAFAFGAAMSRVEVAVRLAGEQAECALHGLYAMDGSRHADHHLMVDHAKAATRSNQLYKGVLDDHSRGVFTGRVVVRGGAQKIKAVQANPSLLLGRGAVAETRPQLEIYADDVACNHGATIGRLGDDELFYLVSRGIEPREARRLLVAGFAAEVVESVTPAPLRTALLALVDERVGELGRGRPGVAS